MTSRGEPEVPGASAASVTVPSPVPQSPEDPGQVLGLRGAKLAAVYLAMPLLAVLCATLVTNELRDGVDGPAEALATVLFAVLVPATILLLWISTQSWTRLRADGLDTFNGFTHRAMAGSDFRGFRRTRGFATVALVPRDPATPAIRVPMGVLTARATIPWLQALHNLERDDLTARIAESESDVRLGATPAQRRTNLRQLRAAARTVGILGWAIAIWVWMYPRPYDLALLCALALPVAAMTLHLWSLGLLRLDYRVEHPAPSIASLFYPPALALFLRAIADINMVDYVGTLLVGVLATGALTAIIVISDPLLLRQGWRLLGTATGLLGFMLGILSFANAQLDDADAGQFRTRVIDVHVTSGKAHLDELVLEPWGPFRKPVSAYVPPAVYDRVSDDEVVCVRLHQGRFGWRWFTVNPC